jgi:tetratricopeptide (TPR) repeat protein
VKNPFTLSRLSTFGFAFGGTAIQFAEKLGSVSTACPWIGPLSILAGALAGFGFNRLAAAADKKKELQEATRELLTNRDIAFAQARAVEARLRQYATQLGGSGKSDAAKRLNAIAANANTWWMAIVSDPARAEFEKLRDTEIVTQIAPYLAGEDQLILDKAEWADLLLAADEMTDGEPADRLTPDLAGYFAGYLAGSFTHDFVEALKTDFATEGKAYAAVSLRFFGEILIGLRENAKALEELKPLLEQLPELMGRARQGVSLLRTSGGVPEELYNALGATGERLEDAILNLGRELHERHDDHDRKLAELKAIVQSLTHALAEKGLKPGDLTQDELEIELARRVPNLSAEDIHRLIGYTRFKSYISPSINAPEKLIGREDETTLLNDVWIKAVRDEKSRPHILTFVALGGEGKTSLVAKWAASLADDNWPGCDAVFAWSFYSQGTREQTAVSSDLFLAEALTFFGDAVMAGSAQGAFEKGKRLAQLVGERRALLILDGLEPLQYAPTSPTPGELKDQGLSALLKGLAATSHGLCVVTTRYALPDLRAFFGRTVREEKLARLSRAAGVQLLKAHGVIGSDRRNLPLHDGDAKSEQVSEFEKLVEDVDGHALTLHIMGSFLKKAFGGDIRKRDRVTFAKASQRTDNDHAFRAMAAYARWMAPTGFRAWLRRLFSAKERENQISGKRALAILRLMGLFDRPATADCLAALLAAPAIPGLTEPLTGLPEDDWNCSLESLVAAKLLSVSPETVSVPASAFPLPASLDAHPLLREYFATRVRDGSFWSSVFRKLLHRVFRKFSATAPAWREGHRQLYEHLCTSTKEGDQPTLEALQPLYQAVAHGCQAGLQQEACDEVYRNRILRGVEDYSARKLGAFGSNLGAVACFFEPPWNSVSSILTDYDQAWLFNRAAAILRAMGRLTEAHALAPIGVRMFEEQKQWRDAASSARNLSELELVLGELSQAEQNSARAVEFADRSANSQWRVYVRAARADVLQRSGRTSDAETLFREAEQLQGKSKSSHPLLFMMWGFYYCDLLLTEGERAAWQRVLERCSNHDALQSCRAVTERAAQTLKWAKQSHEASLLDIALDHLTLGRAALYAAILEQSAIPNPQSAIESAVSGLRRAGQSDELPKALLTRAWQRSLTGALTSAQAGPDSAQSDLDEAWEIAARGPMPLFMADIHLYRARLFGVRSAERGMRNEDAPYPWDKHPDGSPRGPKDDLAEARRLIFKHGYLRRKEELEDAEAALL